MHNRSEETEAELAVLGIEEDNATSIQDLENGCDEEHPVRSSSSRLRSSLRLESSVLTFSNVCYLVGKNNKKKQILDDINGTVKFGHVLAIMGPSGAGKTSLINVLTLDAFGGKSTGSVHLNGTPITDRIFKKHCYVVKQHDKHWPFLTCWETLIYAAQLYQVGDKNNIPTIVDDVISKMGMENAKDVRCGKLSGGQKRRLSIALALLKQPTLLFLDEPTSGLDSAAASSIMEEIRRLAKAENLVIVCTIHQPSSKVYAYFDEVMILSQGREAFTGKVGDSQEYFKSIGYPMPKSTNPAEFFLDLVNSDFTCEEEVNTILDAWKDRKAQKKEMDGVQDGVAGSCNEGIGGPNHSLSTSLKQKGIMYRRHGILIARDPVLYLGRTLIFLLANVFFALVYLKARNFEQAQALNKMWLTVWFVGVPSNMGVVAVYALNDEFKSIMREMKNGMSSPTSYVLAKSTLVLPIMLVFSVFAMGIPAYAIQDYVPSSFGLVICVWAVVMFVFECLAEALSVVVNDPIMGMLCFMSFWFASFLFGGFLIPRKDMFWPFELFYYIMPYSYGVRSLMYSTLIDSTWEPCYDPTSSAVCVPSGSGADVLDGIGKVYPLISSENTVASDIGILLALACAYKIIYVVGVIVKSRKVTNIG